MPLPQFQELLWKKENKMASMFFPFRTLLCFFVLLPLESLEFICPRQIDPSQGHHYAQIESNISGWAEEAYEKIRIKLNYNKTVKDKPYKELVQKAADFWTNVLSVKPVKCRIFMSHNCDSGNKTVDMEKYRLDSCEDFTKCHDVEVRQEHLDGCKHCTLEGVKCTKNETEPETGVKNADLDFYVSAMATTTCHNDKPLAYAGPCDNEPVLNRPVFAVINI